MNNSFEKNNRYREQLYYYAGWEFYKTIDVVISKLPLQKLICLRNLIENKIECLQKNK